MEHRPTNKGFGRRPQAHPASPLGLDGRSATAAMDGVRIGHYYDDPASGRGENLMPPRDEDTTTDRGIGLIPRCPPPLRGLASWS
jgi:hypothetical protein